MLSDMILLGGTFSFQKLSEGIVWHLLVIVILTVTPNLDNFPVYVSVTFNSEA